MKRILLFLLCHIAVLSLLAEEAVIEITEFDNKTQEFRLNQYGRVPVGSFVDFWNTFGYVSGNRYNQIPGNHNATLTLVGWDGCVIDSITLAMCSNNSAGNVRLTVTAGSTSLFTMPTKAFNDPDWYGAWLSKDCQVYGDITKAMQTSYVIHDTDEVTINISGGTTKGESVYLQRITIHYQTHYPTQSPLGYVYQKMEKKDVLHHLDTVLFFRSGYVPGDFGGMTNGTLDAETMHSYSDVYEPWIIHFVAHQDGTNWRFIDLYSGDTLCTSGLKNLNWNNGVATWTVTMDYSGAIITSTNTSYGTICFNQALSNGTGGFRTYAKSSNDCPLPYLYRRVRQNQPVAATSLDLPSARIAYIDTTLLNSQSDTCVFRATLSPKTVTDKRLRWASSDASIASVRDGIVYLHGLGQVTITCTTWDGLHTASCILDILPKEVPAPETALDNIPSYPATKTFINGQLVITRYGRRYTVTGLRLD